MKTIAKLVLSVAVPLAAVAAYAAPAEAQVVYTYPSAAYVASYQPVYYNGYAHYYYNNSWYYRDHGGWHGYATEPGYLHGYRGGWAGRRYGWR
jgi:hypothetical protein